jgi:hypothetical protein
MTAERRSDDPDNVTGGCIAVGPGGFPLGSILSRAAARMLLKDKTEAANREAEVRLVFDLSGKPCPEHISRHKGSDGKITDLIFPAHELDEACYGVFEVPRGMSLEEAYRQARMRPTFGMRTPKRPQDRRNNATGPP